MTKLAVQKFLDLQLRSTVNLERYSEGVRRKVFKLLNDTQNEILSEILKQETRAPIAEWRKRRLRNLQKSIDGILDTNYAKIAKVSRHEMEQLSLFTAKETVAHLNGVIGAQLANVTLTPESLKAIASNTMIDGQVIGKWWGDQKDDFKRKAARQMADATQAVQLGMVRGEAINELVGRIRGTALAPGIMDMGKRNATALVRTSVMQVANEARMDMYEGNKDLIDGYEFVATLDKRTSTICRAYDGKQWIEDGKPVPTRAPRWKPTMTEKEADLWAKDSIYKGSVFHGTSAGKAIRGKGFDLDYGVTGRYCGDGVYLSTPKVAGGYIVPGGELLECKLNIKKTFDYRKIQQSTEAQIRFEMDQVKWLQKLKASNLPVPQGKSSMISEFLKSQGNDSLIYESGEPKGIVHVIFNPKNVTVVKK